MKKTILFIICMMALSGTVLFASGKSEAEAKYGVEGNGFPDSMLGYSYDNIRYGDGNVDPTEQFRLSDTKSLISSVSFVDTFTGGKNAFKLIKVTEISSGVWDVVVLTEPSTDFTANRYFKCRVWNNPASMPSEWTTYYDSLANKETLASLMSGKTFVLIIAYSDADTWITEGGFSDAFKTTQTALTGTLRPKAYWKIMIR
jgi:hypothetical protein